MSPVATSDAAFRGGACPTPEYTIAYTGNYTTSADASQIIGVLREHEAGVKTAELCRKHGISDATFYNWKAKYGGMTVSEAARLRTLEDENRRLKKLLAESMLDVSALKDLLGKN